MPGNPLRRRPATTGPGTGERGPRIAMVAAAFAALHLTVAAPAQTTLESPNGVVERCVSGVTIPGGRYSEADRATEQAYCAADFYSGQWALCPKLFSTSPGSLVYDLRDGPYAGKAKHFEADQCRTTSPVKHGAGAPLSFKMTMNAKHTSATFSTASLLYYHFSRYFQTAVTVPVSVFRSMDRAAHAERVTGAGLRLSGKRKGAAMNRHGWETMRAAESNPRSYAHAEELFTDGGRQVYGVLLRPSGRRYGPEVNGTPEIGVGQGTES